MNKSTKIGRLAEYLEKESGPLISRSIGGRGPAVFDFTSNNPILRGIDTADPIELGRYLGDVLMWNNARIGIGRYNEERILYSSELFRSGGEKRNIHLGVDIFTDAGTEVLCPLDGAVHSFQNNSARGDFGPTIILEHTIKGKKFYTLYGHLSIESIKGLHEGMNFKKGDVLCRIGDISVNGGWPAHLHFQVISDLKGRRGDFPGVCSPSQRARYLELCPDPNAILKIPALGN